MSRHSGGPREPVQRTRAGAREAWTVTAVKCRFARAEGVVERAFEGSEAFRSLCRDYLTCAATLARWQTSQAAGAQLRVQEYSELLDELAHEIEARLGADER